MEILELQNKFEASRNLQMSKEEFQILLLTYPVFLVAKADGKFDNEEREFIHEVLMNFLEQVYQNELTKEQYGFLAENYLEDFNFLESKDSTFKLDFLKGLRSFDKEILQSIEDMLHEIGNISGGLSEIEAKTIDEIKTKFLDR